MKPTLSIARRLEDLVADHLTERDADRLGPVTGEAEAALGLGEWPVALTDAMTPNGLGLWVLTTERSLWFGLGDADVEEVWWPDVGSVSIRTGQRAHDLALGGREGSAPTLYADVGDLEYAWKLEWAVHGLASLAGEPQLCCPDCLIGIARSDDGLCVLCAAELAALPGRDLGDGPVASRVRRTAAPDVLAQLAPAARAAERALAPNDRLAIVTDAIVWDAPALMVADGRRGRVWDVDGALRFDRPQTSVTVVRNDAAAEIELADSSIGQRMILEGVGPPAWVDDLLYRMAAEPQPAAQPAPAARSAPPERSAPGPRSFGETEVADVNTLLQIVGGVLIFISFILFRVVGIPVTETYGPEGYSESWSWGHIVGYALIGVTGAGLVWLGRTPDRK